MKHKSITNGNRSKNTAYLIAAIICCGFLILGILFMRHAWTLGRQETIKDMHRSTEQSRDAVKSHIKDNFHRLKAVTVLAEDNDFLKKDKLLNSLTQILEKNTYVTIGFVYKNGNAIWIDSEKNIHESRHYETKSLMRSISGINVLTESGWDPDNNIFVNYYALPVQSKGKTIGVLFAADPEKELKNTIKKSLYSRKGYANIIKKNGDFAVTPDNPVTSGTGNIFSAQANIKESSKTEMLENMSNGKSGYSERKVNGEKRLTSYIPLGINDWFICYGMPEKLVNTNLRFVTNGAITIIAAAMAIFIIFILLIWHTGNTGRKELEKLAFEDALTGQKNLQKFLIDAKNILKKNIKTRYSIWSCDIKNFKYINDLFGLEAGDTLLKHWAGYLLKNTGDDEVFARVNADNFVYLRSYKNKKDLEKRFYRDVSLFEKYSEIEWKIELCCGVCNLNPDENSISVSNMIDRANVAKKSVKDTTGCGLGFYSKKIREQKIKENEIESGMEKALENNEFNIYLQPKINIQNHGTIGGMEALVRWLPPGKGIIPPSEFIKLFEKNGFIVKLDRYVFEKACETYKKNILDEGHQPIILSVNVSRLGILHLDFVKTYVSIKNKYKIPNGQIELEFTESLAFENHKQFKSTIKELQKNGFLCSLDDFGSGHSSLNILKALRVDVIKLDRLFFCHGEDSERGLELVKNIIAMAKALKIKTVAEGIELKNQVDLLRKMGCDSIQGYVFAKPMAIDDFKFFLKQWQGETANS